MFAHQSRQSSKTGAQSHVSYAASRSAAGPYPAPSHASAPHMPSSSNQGNVDAEGRHVTAVRMKPAEFFARTMAYQVSRLECTACVLRTDVNLCLP